MKREDVAKLEKHFPEADFYMDKDDFIQAIEEKRMANVIDVKCGDKIDFWVLSGHPFNIESFNRKVQEDFMGIKVNFPTPEDVILLKLKWSKESGGSKKQIQDARGVYEVYRDKLDVKYIEKWVEELGISDLWEEIKSLS
jgi:hypothetical protein